VSGGHRETVAGFYDDFVDYELDSLRHPNRRLRRVHERLEPLLAERRPRSALDVGCGIGITTAWLAERVPSVVGVDISPRTIETAARVHDGPEFRVAAVPDDPLPEGPFDLVTFIDVLEHFPSGTLSRIFARIDEAIAADGVLAVNVPSKLFALRGESQQVIDEGVGVDELTAAAAGRGMEPLVVDRYGVETANQYVFCAFARSYDVSTPLPFARSDWVKNTLWHARSRLTRRR
jgi:2-polyprenyl-3-methyl-5-hydroxy-6-metoxy-1,4-benzoquinol methylase